MTTLRSSLLLAVLLVVVAVAGCDALGLPEGQQAGPYPQACAALGFPDRQCKAIVNAARERSGVDSAAIVAINFLPFRREMSLGGGQIALVQFQLEDGTAVEQEIRCGGVAFGPVCHSDAVIMVASGVDRDVPCTGEPPEGCATLPPTPPPDVVLRSEPLRVDSIDVPIDHMGHYEVLVGRATLPNGYLSERSLSLADRTPDAYWLEGVRLDVRPDDETRPWAGSIYRDSFEGPEPVTVYLVFDVTDLERPDTVRVRDVVVR